MSTNQNAGPKVTRRDSFVVRIWQEEGDSDWAGWVQHVNTGESARVRRLDDLLLFIEHCTGKLETTAQKGLK
ncbi:MAG: hypothetical protein JXM73_17820 [Anaerolineae bacterium]|nr:hypothetical protein [Anaerolineae bacterium]